MHEPSVEQNLNALMAWANRDGVARLRMKDDGRTIRWEIEGTSYYWKIDGGGVAWTEPGPAECSLRCSRDVLRKLARREVLFFLAIWATGEVQFDGDFPDAFRLGYLLLGDKRTRRIVYLPTVF